MPIENNRFFGKINEVVDFIAQDNLRREQRSFGLRQLAEKRRGEDERFRKRGQIETILSLAKSGRLTPESEQGVLTKLLAGSDFAPGDVQLQPQPFITTGERETAVGMAPGTRVPLSEAGGLLRLREPKQENMVTLSKSLTDAMQLPEGQQVPVNQYDSYYRAYLSKIKENRLTKSPKQMSVSELGGAIDDTRVAIRDLQQQDSREGLTDEEYEDLKYLQGRHRDLLKEQDKKLGRKAPPSPRGEPQKPLGKISDPNEIEAIRTQLKNLTTAAEAQEIAPEEYQTRLREIHQALGGDEQAFQFLKKELGF